MAKSLNFLTIFIKMVGILRMAFDKFSSGGSSVADYGYKPDCGINLNLPL